MPRVRHGPPRSLRLPLAWGLAPLGALGLVWSLGAEAQRRPVDTTGRRRAAVERPAVGRGQALGATATSDCAPWDGPAIRLAIDLSAREQLVVSLWGAGLERLTGGRSTIALDGVPSVAGMGQAYVCPPIGGSAATPCRPVSARLELDASGRRDGDPLRGRVVLREEAGPQRTYAFAVRIRRPSGSRRCG